MPATLHRITPEDLLPDSEYAKVRRERRAALLPVKRLRRVALGPVCTVYFESYETMLFQVQEMLLTEKGGPAQILDELEAYNPLIPQGRELVATIMLEIEDPVRRDATLRRLSHVEDEFFLQVGEHRVSGQPEGDVERTRDDGKTSSVHFVRFPLDASQIVHFNDPAIHVLVGCDHESYGHLAVLTPATRGELAKDFAA
ncbi:MAG TPA: DUF3501 family protein [Caulobacteraceae bacterium]|nr:DUF3501 family protein [Caulobacteraceae bacterium]